MSNAKDGSPADPRRFKQIPVENLTPEQRTLYDAIRSGPRATCKLERIEAGLDPAVAQDIAEGRRPAKMDADEAVVYDFSSELHEKHGVSDASYKRAVDRFGERGVFDLIAANGFYSLVAMCLNVDRTPLPEGVPQPLK